jgi:hypothetical protein
MSVGLLLAIVAGVFIVYLVMRSSSGSGDDSV